MLAWRWRDDDVLVHSLPLSHQHGLTGVHATLLAGSRAVIQPSLDPARLSAAIAAERATVLFAVPALYERLISWGGGGDISSLRLATSGSAPLAPGLWERARKLIGREPVERYGTTESGLDASNPYDGPRRPGSVGIPLPGIEIAIADSEGKVLADGVDGEVLVRGPHVFDGYWRNDRATRQSFRPTGWFRTGDVGRLDPDDGYLSITGRLKEMIISGGLNVYPREVELVLEGHPAVGRAAVVGVPSQRWGEEVVAFIVPARGEKIDAEEIRSHARRLLAPHKCPKVVHQAEEVPVNALGKVLRPELVALAERLRASPQTERGTR
jgi:malonyl-CoA/methylmalonyl-CoA synthetase